MRHALGQGSEVAVPYPDSTVRTLALIYTVHVKSQKRILASLHPIATPMRLAVDSTSPTCQRLVGA